MFGSLDPAKIFVILVVALIVLGPERLPKAAKQLGAAWRELTRIREQVADEVRAALPDVDLPRIPKNPGAAVSGFISDLTRGAGPAAAGDPGPAGGVEAAANGADPGGDGLAPPGAGGPGPGGDRLPWGGARPARRGVPAPEGGAALVVADPVRGDLAFVPDDPGMN